MGYGTGLVLVAIVGMVIGGLAECWKFGVITVDSGGVFSVRLDFSGGTMFYSYGIGIFLVVGWG